MAFEKFIPPRSGVAKPKATIRPSGLISFDAASVEAFNLGTAKFAVLYFDKAKKIVGVKITKTDKEDGSIKLSRRRRSVSLKSPQFFEQYALTIEDSQKFDATWDETNDMIIVNLKTVQRRRGRRPKKA
jgi:hypothetical protein